MAIRPIIKIMLQIALGIVVSKTRILTVEGSKMLATLIIWVLYPCMQFTNIVRGIQSNELQDFAIMNLGAAYIHVICFLMGLGIFWITTPPKGFRYGTIMATAMGTHGDLPLAIIATVGNVPPFNDGDSVRGAALVSSFLCFVFLSYNSIGFILFKEDLLPSIPEKLAAAPPTTHQFSTTPFSRFLSDATAPMPTLPTYDSAARASAELQHRQRTISPFEMYRTPEAPFGAGPNRRITVQATSTSTNPFDFFRPAKEEEEDNDDDEKTDPDPPRPDSAESSSDTILPYDDGSALDFIMSHGGMSLEEIKKINSVRNEKLRKALKKEENVPLYQRLVSGLTNFGNTMISPLIALWTYLSPYFMREGIDGKKVSVFALSVRSQLMLKSLANFANIATILGLIVTAISPIRSLFIAQDTTTVNAPLGFVFEVSAFVGSAAVPMAMTNLGAAIGRLRFGKAFKALPSSIVVLIAVARLIVMPIIGILTVRGLVSGGVLDKENKMLQFVLMLQSCVPTASTCAFFTQMFHPKGEAHAIANVILFQYMISMVTMSCALLAMIRTLN